RARRPPAGNLTPGGGTDAGGGSAPAPSGRRGRGGRGPPGRGGPPPRRPGGGGSTRPGAARRPAPGPCSAGRHPRPRRPPLSWRLGLAAAAGLLVVATVLAALTIWLAPATVAKPLGVASNALDIVATIVNGILAVPRVLFADRPAVIAGYAVLVIIVCGLWVR